MFEKGKKKLNGNVGYSKWQLTVVQGSRYKH